ncbi:hypothetical protein KEM54_001684 [Ascosphaera aggregata]|nr:hypothetical protein KEM54_001684 [Ascosphaera aggregata]
MSRSSKGGPSVEQSRRFSLPTARLLSNLPVRDKSETNLSSRQSRHQYVPPNQPQHQQPQSQSQSQSSRDQETRPKTGRRMLSSMGLAMKKSDNLSSTTVQDVPLDTQHKHTSSLASRGSYDKSSSYKKADNTFLARSKALGSAGKRLFGGHRSSSKDISNNQSTVYKEPRQGDSRLTLTESGRDRPGPRLQALSLSPDEITPTEDCWDASSLEESNTDPHVEEATTTAPQPYHLVDDKPPVLELPGITVPETPPSASAVPGLLRAGVQTPEPHSRPASRGDMLSLLTAPNEATGTEQPPASSKRKSRSFDTSSAITGDELEQHLNGQIFLSSVELPRDSRISMTFIDDSLRAEPEEDGKLLHILPTETDNIVDANPPLRVMNHDTDQPRPQSQSSFHLFRPRISASCYHLRPTSSSQSGLTMSPTPIESPAPSVGSSIGDRKKKHRISRKPLSSLSSTETSSTELDGEPTGTRLELKISNLTTRLGDLERRQKCMETTLIELNNAIQPVICTYETRKEIKKSMGGIEDELAELKKEQHELGLKLARYHKKEEAERTLGDSSGGMWSRRVTG